MGLNREKKKSNKSKYSSPQIDIWGKKKEAVGNQDMNGKCYVLIHETRLTNNVDSSTCGLGHPEQMKLLFTPKL